MKIWIVRNKMDFYAYDCGEDIIGVYKYLNEARDKIGDVWSRTKEDVKEFYKDELDFDLVITDKVVEPDRGVFTTNYPSPDVPGKLYGETYEVWIEESELK